MQDIEHSANLQFAECLPKGTRQKVDTRQRLVLPSATRAALGTQPHVCAAHARRARYPSRPLLFAECPQGDTRQTPLCRVPRSGHSAKTITCAARDCYPVATNVTPLRRPLPLSFAECQVGALGKDLLMPSAIIVALGIQTLCRVSSLALGEITKKKFSNTVQTFFLATILYKTLHIRIWYIFCYVYYI